jgi:hypothetical protein
MAGHTESHYLMIWLRLRQARQIRRKVEIMSLMTVRFRIMPICKKMPLDCALMKLATRLSGTATLGYCLYLKIFMPASNRSHNTARKNKLRIRNIQSMISCAGKKRLYLSRERVLFGLTPWIVVSGNPVCILHGSFVPIMLRKSPSNGRSTVVGQCYLEEWMQGEHLYQRRRS